MRSIVLAMLVLLGLVAPTNAETSTQIAKAKPSEALKYFKGALKNAAVKDGNVRKEDKFVTLTSCNSATEYIGEDRNKDTTVSDIADLAYDVVYLQTVLRLAGYPQSHWESDLAEYERHYLAALDKYDILSDSNGSPEKQHLAKKLNDYKKATKGHFKDVIPGIEGCGAGEVQVRIRTTPSAQRVQYINVVKYNLCTLQGLDPKGTSCDHWLDYSAHAAEGAQMSGKYKLRATWSDGTTVFRDLDVDDLVEDRNGLYRFTISKR